MSSGVMVTVQDLPKRLSRARQRIIMNDSTQGGSWWQRLSGGLKRTSATLGGAISSLVTKRKLDAGAVEELEHELIRADLGPEFAARIASVLGEGRFDKTISPDEVKAMLAGEIEQVLVP